MARRPSNPCIPHFAPATFDPNVIASCKVCPLEMEKIVEATNVSPAPSVSTTLSGENIGVVQVAPSRSMAMPPASPHGQIKVALQNKTND